MTRSHPMVPDLLNILNEYTQEDQRKIFDYLRKRFPIHPLEEKLNTSAEIILEAISRASDLTLRGVRGIIAEAAFKQDVIIPYTQNGLWKEIPLSGDYPFDFSICDSVGRINIQVKMQRQKELRPMLATEASKKYFSSLDDYYVVETQRTRGGKTTDGEATRPYKFGEFDILAVALHPSTKNWSDFIYTVEGWLFPTPGKPSEVFKYQPVPKNPNEHWTSDITEVIQWFRSGITKTIPVTK